MKRTAQARTEPTEGRQPGAMVLARSIVTSQSAQIASMRAVLAGA